MRVQAPVLAVQMGKAVVPARISAPRDRKRSRVRIGDHHEAAERSGMLKRYPNVDGVVPVTHTSGCGMAGKGEGYDAGTMKKKVDALPDAPEVHYNPANPAEAFLVLTAAWWPWLAIIVGALLTLFGGVLTLSRFTGGGSQ